MTINPPLPPFAGQTVEVNYDGLAALNDYDEDGLHMTYTITAGDFAGAQEESNTIGKKLQTTFSSSPGKKLTVPPWCTSTTLAPTPPVRFTPRRTWTCIAFKEP